MEYKPRINKLFELFFNGIITVIGLLAITVSTYSHWENGVTTWSIIAMIVTWAAYLLDIGTKENRLIVCTVFVDIILIIYGLSPVCFTDVPILICLFLTIVAFGEDIRLQHILVFAYPILIVYHFFTGYISMKMGSLAMSRILLGIFCIGCTATFARFILVRQKVEREKIEDLEGKLHLSEKENDRFMANISHELRTPINAVNGASQILLGKELEEDVKKNVEGIYAAGRRLHSQISDILDYSEIITDELVVADTNYEIVSLINDFIENLVWVDKEKNIELTIDVEPEIPSVLYGDPQKIRKVISVLVENSIKFTQEGGVYVRVSKSDESYGINLIIDVYDTGCGMSEEDIESIYKGFDRINLSQNKKFPGLGLGLSIVYGFVSKMGGNMVIKSKEGKSSHIRVTLPQRVINSRPSMTLAGSDKYKIICYFNMEKYSRPEIGQYYQKLIDRVKNSFTLDIKQVHSLANVKESFDENVITHVIVSRWEYEMDPYYFDELAKKVFVVVLAEPNFCVPEGSRIIHVKKPLFIYHVIDVLKETSPGMTRQEIEGANIELEGMKALVVDDDSMNISVAKGMLEAYGVNVHSALSGELAVEKCMIEDYDIIFMDIMMPKMDGIECMNRIRMIRKNSTVNIPIIAVTANAVSGAREKFIKEGFDDFIPKPIEMSVLSRVLKKYYKGGRIDG